MSNELSTVNERRKDHEKVDGKMTKLMKCTRKSTRWNECEFRSHVPFLSSVNSYSKGNGH